MNGGIMINPYKWFKKKIALKLFPFVVSNAPEGLYAYIQEKAAEMANKIVLDKMASVGLITCAYCARRSPLRKIDGRYYCPTHVESVVKHSGIKAKDS